MARALADALRRMHDSGVAHGALEPSCVISDASGVSIEHDGAEHRLTAYSAPEQAQGKGADTRSDIFGFGAILYEMLAGRRPFTGEGDELREAILNRQPAPLEGVSAGLARLVSRCLAKAPAQRWQRVQNIQMELKLLGVMARRSEQSVELREQGLHTLLRNEIAQLEERFAGRLSAIEGTASNLRSRFEEEAQNVEMANQAARDLRADVTALLQRMEGADRQRKSYEASSVEAAAEIAVRLDGLDRALEAHNSSIESLGTAVTQSGDLIEGLVDALDSVERSLTGEQKKRTAMVALSS